MFRRFRLERSMFRASMGAETDRTRRVHDHHSASAPVRTDSRRRGDPFLMQRLVGSHMLLGQNGPVAARDARRFYGVTGEAIAVPALATLRTWPLSRLRNVMGHLSRHYGTQNAAQLIRLREAIVSHPSRRHGLASLGEPTYDMDQEILGTWDRWEGDAARYREYLSIYGRRGRVEMLEGHVVPRLQIAQNGSPGSQTGTPAATSLDAVNSLPTPQTGNVAATLESVVNRLGDVSDWVEFGTILGEIITGGAELTGAIGLISEITGVVGLYAGPIATLLSVLEAADTDLKIDQVMGFVYGVLYAINFLPGPTGLPYGGRRGQDAERHARFDAGVALGRAQVAGDRRRTVRLRLAVHQYGSYAVLNALWRRVATSALTNPSDIAHDFTLSWPHPGLEELRTWR
jgi:hypothetical protein